MNRHTKRSVIVLAIAGTMLTSGCVPFPPSGGTGGADSAPTVSDRDWERVLAGRTYEPVTVYGEIKYSPAVGDPVLVAEISNSLTALDYSLITHDARIKLNGGVTAELVRGDKELVAGDIVLITGVVTSVKPDSSGWGQEDIEMEQATVDLVGY